MDKDFRVKLGLHVGANAYISNSITHIESVVFANNLTDYSPAQGELFWNPDDRTIDLETGGTTLQIGQEEYYLVKNQTGNTIPNGQAVMAAGSLGASGRILATPAIADGSFPSKYFMGIATEDIANGEDGFVTQFGLVRKIDTGMFNEGDILYADPSVAGGLSNSAPTAPNNIITAAIVLNSSNTTGSIFVRPTFTGKLQELEDLVLDNLSDNAIINWSSSNSRFELVQHYSDASVAEYLDVGSATANQVLSWTGSNYDWVDQSAGGGGTDYGDSNVDLHLNTASATANQVLSWTGSDYSWVDQSAGGGGTDYGDSNVDLHLNTASATANQVLSWTGSDYDWVDQSAGGAGIEITASDSAPVSPSGGDLWFNTSDTTLAIYYEDADSNQWVVVSGATGAQGDQGPQGNTGPEANLANSVLSDLSDVSNTAPIDGQVLTWNLSSNTWLPSDSLSGNGSASVTTADTPPSSPSDGDLWFNSSDSTLSVYYQDIDSGQWVVTSGPQGIPGTDGSNAEVYSGNTAPGSPSPRTLWFNTDDASMYFYYDDATSNQWVAISGPTGPQGPQGEQGPAGADGGVTTGKAIAMAIVFG